MNTQVLPKWFQKLYWWGDSSSLDVERHKRTIVTQIINYGRWEHWQWLFKTYGKKNLRKVIREIPVSEFRARALRLASILLGIHKMKYASRSDYIRAKRSSL